MTVESDVQKPGVGSVVELFELDATALGGAISRFHAGTNEYKNTVVWQGQSYLPWPIKVEGFEWSGEGSPPRPKMAISNQGGIISALVVNYQDLVGAKLTRKKTLVKYLDSVNFNNIARQSEDISASPWVAAGATIVGPDRFISQGTYGEVAQQIYLGQAVSGANPGEKLYTVQAVVRGVGTGIGKIAMFWVGTPAQPYISGGSFLLTGSDVTVTVNTIDLYPYTGDTIIFHISAPGLFASIWPAGAEMRISKIQLNLGGVALPYQKTGGTEIVSDPNAHFPDEVYYVKRKVREDSVIQWELGTPYDVQGVRLPLRPVISTCWWEYKKGACTYAGSNFFRATDEPTINPGEDVCGKRLSSCKARFGSNAVLPFGGMPSAGLVT